MPPPDAKPSAETLRRVVAAPPLALYDALKAVPVPVMAVVRGRAIGVGCALAGVCDLALAADDAVFQIPEMERDIPPTLVMSALIGRVPVKTVAHMVLSRATLNASEALQAGPPAVSCRPPNSMRKPTASPPPCSRAAPTRCAR